MESSKKVALVTGASSGIGRAAAVALGRKEYAVLLTARRAERLAEAVDEIRRSGGAAEFIACDLVRPGVAASLAREVVSRFGRLDLLVNDAGWGYCSPLAFVPEEAARTMIELNIVAPILLTKECLPELRRARGTVINVASGSGLLPSPWYAVYGATKAALVSLSDSLRIEERDNGVRVVSICPGPVTSGFFQAAGGAPVHADRLGIKIQTADEIGRIIVRQARRPGRTVATTGAVWLGGFLNRFAPRLFDLIALQWARKVRPEVEQPFLHR